MTAPSDPTALVAELREAAAAAAFGKSHGTLIGPAHYAALIGPLDRAAALIAQQAATIEAVTKEASGLAVALWRGHYLEAAPDWRPFDDPVGLLTQIDNMTAGLREKLQVERARAIAAEAERDRLVGLLDRLVNAKAISGVRDLVAGWNGENRPDGPYPRHDARLGATLPKANCGQIYELDDAMQSARAAIGSHAGVPYRPRNLAEADKDLRHDQPDRLRPHHRRLPHAADEALSSTERAALSAKEQPDV